MTYDTLRDFLNHSLTKSEKTLTQIASETGLEKTSLQAIFAGIMIPNRSSIEMIAVVLEVSLEEAVRYRDAAMLKAKYGHLF